MCAFTSYVYNTSIVDQYRFQYAVACIIVQELWLCWLRLHSYLHKINAAPHSESSLNDACTIALESTRSYKLLLEVILKNIYLHKNYVNATAFTFVVHSNWGEV